MQYPEIQFYRGSLVRLASGQLKQVEDLSSDDFIESAKIAVNNPSGKQPVCGSRREQQMKQQQQQQQQPNRNCNTLNQDRNGFSLAGSGHRNGTDENNNSVFNSPEPTSGCFDDSPRMRTDDHEEEDEEIDVELDVVTTHDEVKSGAFDLRTPALGANRQQQNYNLHQYRSQNLASRNQASSMQQVKLEPFGSSSSVHSSSTTTPFNLNPSPKMEDAFSPGGRVDGVNQDFYIDSSVVRDFLEVEPIQRQANQRLPASTSPASSTNSLNNQDQHHSQTYSLPSTSSSSSSNSLQSSISPPVVMPQILSAASPETSQTVLIKFFLETSRSVVFIEVPIEHPFFVFHRGWSSWNPQRTYDKFGLKCRKLKIGDTCISLIRRKQNSNQQQDSDQCNILFSSIKINE